MFCINANITKFRQKSIGNGFGQEIIQTTYKRRPKIDNYVTGRWVLTIKVDKDGQFKKFKARWVCRGFQDAQKYDLQTD